MGEGETLNRLAALPDFEAPTLEAALRGLAEELGVNLP